MHGYNFTQNARDVLASARQEAGVLCHEYLGPEHILLGLLREETGGAHDILKALATDADALREQLVRVLRRGRAHSVSGDLPYTSRAKKVIELALTAARELAASHVGTEHLLIGLVREEKGIAAQVLFAAGVTEQFAWQQALLLHGGDRHDELLGTPAKSTARPAKRIVIEIEKPDGSVERQVCRSTWDAILFLLRP